MQIRPIVARHFNVPVDKLNDTETNIRLASMLLGELGKMLRIPAEVSNDDRMKIILASYNAGVGHVQDARRLARAEGANPNSWADVSRYLRLKADPTYYNKEEVRYGRFTGSGQTLSYVEEVMGKYRHYCSLT
jgi:membrane-bound lytic murein transglycosylase F